jgi:nitroreductase
METSIETRTSSEIEFSVMDAIKRRKSLRAYADKPVEDEKIKSLFEAARWAPSAVNEQPWAYLYATKEQGELYHKLWETLNDGNKVWAKNAPVLILSMARKNFTMNGNPNGVAKYDLGQANAFLTLQATELGLNVHQMGGFDRIKAMETLNIPQEFDLGVMIAIGYPGSAESLPENLKQRELAPRIRKAQEEFIFNQSF